MRRWRGEIDVPLTDEGRDLAQLTGIRLEHFGGLTLCYHDWLSRCRDTAKALCPITAATYGPRPWKMGRAFEGHPITPQSIQFAQWMVEHPTISLDPTGEPFGTWYSSWMKWLDRTSQVSHGKIGVVTHNRNIQAVYATDSTGFRPELYNCDGPDFCTVHYYGPDHKLISWDGTELVDGIYLIRHAPTAWGT